MSNTQYSREACEPYPHRLLVFKQFGKLNAEHKGLDTPSEDNDEPHKQSTRKQKDFPQEVKTVNLLHVTNRMAPTEIRTIRPIPKESH